jgi:hypothetical protein
LSALSVIRVTPLPSAFIVKILSLPSRALEKTILLPLADQTGYWSWPVAVVRRVWPLPSAFMT